MSTVTNLEEKRGKNMEDRGGVIPERFIVNLQGKDFIKYEGLLELGHQKGIKSLKVDLIQIPSKENGYLALAKATLVGKDDTVYEDYGDATPNNCNKKVIPHIIRMASTRAKARTLRDYTNVGMTSIEELGSEDEVLTNIQEEVDPITSKQKACLQDNFDKIAHLFSSIEDINGLSKTKASELIGKYIMNTNNKSSDNKSTNSSGKKEYPSNESDKKDVNTSSKTDKASEQKNVKNTTEKQKESISNNQTNKSTVEDKEVKKDKDEKKVNNIEKNDSNSDEPITSGQAGYIHVLIKQAARKLNKDKSEIEKQLLNKYGADKIENLPKKHGKAIIEGLKKNTVA